MAMLFAAAAMKRWPRFAIVTAIIGITIIVIGSIGLEVLANATNFKGGIESATQLCAGWSSGDVDAPEPFMTPDAVLNDVASGRFEGWPAIRAFFGQAGQVGRPGPLPDEFG
jgi:hypothetical protein